MKQRNGPGKSTGQDTKIHDTKFYDSKYCGRQFSVVHLVNNNEYISKRILNLREL